MFNVNDLLPTYFEVEAVINADKPTAGSKSNSYVIFDYHSPTDFKFAGINVSIDKIQMGHRDESGWVVDAQTPAQLKPNRDYDVLLSINGVTATLVVDNDEVFSYVYEPRIVDGLSFGLNSGMVGLGSENSTARIDNVRVQVLPPETTLEATDEFDGVDGLFTGTSQGQWVVAGTGESARYEGQPSAGASLATSTTSLGIGSPYVLQLQAVVSTDSLGGIVFDQYAPKEFKFAAVSAVTGHVMIGHHTAKRGLVVDASIDRGVLAGTDYILDVSLKGSTVSVSLDNQSVLGYAFNSVTVDGEQRGVLSVNGVSSFDSFTVKTNDPAYLDAGDAASAVSAGDGSGDGVVVIVEETDPGPGNGNGNGNGTGKGKSSLLAGVNLSEPENDQTVVLTAGDSGAEDPVVADRQTTREGRFIPPGPDALAVEAAGPRGDPEHAVVDAGGSDTDRPRVKS